MAMTHDYLEFLDERIGISPTNSEEELQAAEVISDLMGQHNVEASIEEFDEPLVSGLVPAVLAFACLLGMVLVGVGVLPLTLIGFVLAVAPAALSVARLFGRAPRLTLGPRAQSQNVVAVHRATGPLVTKGSRTIVVAAHYDSPRENFLYSTPLAPYLSLAGRLSVPCSFGVAACALIQLMGFLPAPFRLVVWIVGIIAAVPAVIPAVGAVAERTAPCTDGANDNKAAVAAILGVLENVRPSGAKPKARPVPVPAEQQEAEGDDRPEAAAEAPEQFVETYETEPVIGVRHGEQVLRELAILPESCEIEYVAPARTVVRRPSPAATSELGPTGVVIRADEASSEPSEEEAAVTRADEPLPRADEDVPSEGQEDPDREELLSTGRFEIVMDDGSQGVGPKDTSGLSAMDEDLDADATRPSAPLERPDAPSDPEWGKTSYRPQLSSVARRASLFDLPDPSAGEVDPFATDPNATRVQAPTPAAPAPDDVVVAEPLETIGSSGEEPEGAERPRGGRRQGGLRSLLGKFRGKAGDGDDGDGSDRGWRGGAATRRGLRLVDEDEQPRSFATPFSPSPTTSCSHMTSGSSPWVDPRSTTPECAPFSLATAPRYEAASWSTWTAWAPAISSPSRTRGWRRRAAPTAGSSVSSPGRRQTCTSSSVRRRTTGRTPTPPPPCARRFAPSPSWVSTATACPRSPARPRT